MKQKIVIKVHMACHKCRSKAMKLVAATCGVESVAISGKDRDHLEVVGEGVDSTCLTIRLRKKIGPAHIVEVGELKKEEKPNSKDPPTAVVCAQQWCPNYSRPIVVCEYPPSFSDPCSIL